MRCAFSTQAQHVSAPMAGASSRLSERAHSQCIGTVARCDIQCFNIDQEGQVLCLLRLYEFPGSSLSLHIFSIPPLYPANMRSTWLSLALLPLAASAVNVLVSNDDGWAEINIRFERQVTGMRHLKPVADMVSGSFTMLSPAQATLPSSPHRQRTRAAPALPMRHRQPLAAMAASSTPALLARLPKASMLR